MWGQAGAYDGIDDRSVIATVTGYRTGLATLPVITAGSGLNLTVKAGWAAIVDCGDLTSAVVGARSDQTVTALAGPATGTRADLIWCDVQPDAGTWSLSVINATAAAGRTGLALATLTVPANASLASQMTVAPGAPALERRLLGYNGKTETSTRTGNSWSAATTLVNVTAWAMPGHWYRVVFTALSPAMISGGPDMRFGIGFRPAGGSEASSVAQRHASVAMSTARPVATIFDWTFQYPPGSAPAQRQYDGRMWITGTGSYRTCYSSGISGFGDQLSLTVEDLGQ